MKAIETTAVVDNMDRLKLDMRLPISAQSRVRVIVLYDEEEISEAAWLKVASENPAFVDLDDVEEDIYSPSDGKPFHG